MTAPFTLARFEDIEFKILTPDGNPLFNRTEACNALGLKNASQAAAGLDEDEQVLIDMMTMTTIISDDTKHINDLLRAGEPNRYQWHLTEPGLYHLIRNSRKPVGKRLRRWVDHDVLPEIRKTGSYGSAADIKALTDRLERVEKLTTALISDPRWIQTPNYQPMIDVLINRGIQSKGRRSRATKAANWIDKWKNAADKHDHPMRPDPRGRRHYHVDEIAEWLKDERKTFWGGGYLIKDYLSSDAESMAEQAAAKPGKNVQQVLSIIEGGKTTKGA